MKLKFFISNAFVNPKKLAFLGNPAAVVILDNDTNISNENKLAIARQFNLSQTAFISKVFNEDQFLIRWFSPVEEIKLCGHATMVSSYTLFTEQHQYSDYVSTYAPLKFVTHFGDSLQVTFDTQSVTLNFPQNEPHLMEHSDWLTNMQNAFLGEQANKLFLDSKWSPNVRYLLLRVKDDVDIFSLKPNFSQLLQVATKEQIVVAIIVKKANFGVDKVHYFTRVYAPWVGVNEDPVCGSAFTVSAPYMANVYKNEHNEKLTILYAFQASKRSGIARIELLTDNRILIGDLVGRFCSGFFEV